MSKKIMRIAQDGMLYVNQLNEGDSFSVNPHFVEIGGELIEGYPFVKPVIDDSLVLWLDGSTGNNYEKTNIWKDLSGNGNDGQLMNFNYDENSGWVDGGLRFDGVDDYVNTGKRFTHNNFTIEMLIQSPVERFANILGSRSGLYTDETHPGIDIRFSSGVVRAEIADGKTYSSISTKSLTEHQNHFHIIKKDDVLLAYVDGVLTNTVQTSIKQFTDEYTLKLGARGVLGYYSDLTFHLFRLYNRALTDEEILQNYNAGQCSPLLAMRGDVIG